MTGDLDALCHHTGHGGVVAGSSDDGSRRLLSSLDPLGARADCLRTARCEGQALPVKAPRVKAAGWIRVEPVTFAHRRLAARPVPGRALQRDDPREPGFAVGRPMVRRTGS